MDIICKEFKEIRNLHTIYEVIHRSDSSDTCGILVSSRYRRKHRGIWDQLTGFAPVKPILFPDASCAFDILGY